MKFQSNLNNLANFFVFWENMVKCLVKYVKTILIKQRSINFKKHLRTVVKTSKTWYCHQYSTDFIFLRFLVRELLLHFWLTFRKNSSLSFEQLTWYKN